MNSKVSCISLNTQGLSDPSKRKDVLNCLKSKQYCIYFLQDTHFTQKEENYIRSQWGYECYFSSFSSQSRGVAIFINNNFDFKFISLEKDTEGNMLLLNVKIYDTEITLICVYAPNKDSPSFFKTIGEKISSLNNACIIGGDFNLTLNPEFDNYNYVNVNNPKARETFLQVIIENNLVDVWREEHIEKKEYTWFRKNPVKKARLDFFLISDNLFTEVDETKIIPGYRTDHSMVYIQFQFGKFVKGKSYWKMNNSLLKDHKYVEEIKAVIKNVKLQYIDQTRLLIPNIDIISDEELLFTINDQLFFEILMMEIRGKTIAYASYKKKLEKNREEELFEEIEHLEKELSIQYELLEQKKKELYDIRQKKTRGS